MSSAAITVIPYLDGTNYSTWSTAMVAYLRLQKLIGYINGRYNCPVQTSRVATTAEVTAGTHSAGQVIDTSPADILEKIAIWDDNDDAAIGAISLRLPDHICETAVKDTAAETWTHLKDTYGSPGAAGMFGIFKEAIMFEMAEGVDPAMPISSLQSIFSRLTDAGLILTDSIQAMILLAALPRSMDGLAMSILSQYDAKTLKMADIIPTIQDEFKRRRSTAVSLQSRLSTVKKCPADGSSWNNQKKKKDNQGAPKGPQTGASSQSGNSDGNNNKKKKFRRGGKGKGKGKAQAHEATMETPVATFAAAYIAMTPGITNGTEVSSPPVESFDPYTGDFDPLLANMKVEEEEIDLGGLVDSYMDVYEGETSGTGEEQLIF